MTQKLHLIINLFTSLCVYKIKVMYCQNRDENEYLSISTVKMREKYSLAFLLLLYS